VQNVSPQFRLPRSTSGWSWSRACWWESLKRTCGDVQRQNFFYERRHRLVNLTRSRFDPCEQSARYRQVNSHDHSQILPQRKNGASQRSKLAPFRSDTAVAVPSRVNAALVETASSPRSSELAKRQKDLLRCRSEVSSCFPKWIGHQPVS